MYKYINCPVCGTRNEYIGYSELGFGIIERHYHCPECTYFVEQCYSPLIIGISTDCPEEYIERAKELKLTFIGENYDSRTL